MSLFSFHNTWCLFLQVLVLDFKSLFISIVTRKPLSIPNVYKDTFSFEHIIRFQNIRYRLIFFIYKVVLHMLVDYMKLLKIILFVNTLEMS